MDDEFQSLELELRQLRPLAPPRTLETRVERDLAQSAATSSEGSSISKRWVWTVALSAAAGIALIWSQFIGPASPSEATRRPSTAPAQALAAEMALKPVEAENVLVAARDEGLVTLADGTTAHRERLQFVDTIAWKNPRTNASLRWSIPREEVRVVPVVFQ